MKTISELRTPSATLVVKESRLEAVLRRMISSSPGSKIGTLPRLSILIFSTSLSTQMTRFFISARQAPVTSPT